MKKELANEICKVFDTPWAVEVLSSYADLEIEKANKGLQTSVDTTEIYRLQGVVRAMNILKTIREQAVNTLKG